MKKYALPLALVGLVGLQACNQQTATAPASDPAAAAEPADMALDTTEKRLSYGVAYSLGQRMSDDNMPMNVDAFTAGLRDGLEKRDPRLSQEEIAAEMQSYQQQAMAEAQAAAEEAAVSNAAAAEAFLAENATREGVVVTESGLQYEVVEQGDGATPGAEDQVEVHYRGTLLDGAEIDSSYSRGQTVTFGVGQVIAGWTEALQLMPAGSKWKLYIPPELAYGAGGAGQLIGPNAALVFEVELVSIPSQAAAEAEDAGEGSAEG